MKRRDRMIFPMAFRSVDGTRRVFVAFYTGEDMLLSEREAKRLRDLLTLALRTKPGKRSAKAYSDDR